MFVFHRFLELKTYHSMFTNETSIIASTLRNNPAYVSIYLTWMKIIIIEAIPYISILTLNICILKKVYNASKYRQSFRQSHYIEVVQGTIFIEQNWYFVKVWTFWETHKIWKNLPYGFDKSADLLSKRQNHKEDFFQIMCASQKVQTLHFSTLKLQSY